VPSVCAARDRSVYLYASRRVASSRHYRILITTESIKFEVTRRKQPVKSMSLPRR